MKEGRDAREASDSRDLPTSLLATPRQGGTILKSISSRNSPALNTQPVTRAVSLIVYTTSLLRVIGVDIRLNREPIDLVVHDPGREAQYSTCRRHIAIVLL